MNPLVEINDLMQKWVTISAVWPMLYKLIEEYIKPKDGNKIMKTTKTVMWASLTDRYRDSVMKPLSKLNS